MKTDNRALAHELARQAKEKGICEEWHGRLLKCETKQEMLDMYVKGIDFCLANDYPDNGFIRKHFKGIMEDSGIFLDDSAVSLTNYRRCIALGRTSGTVTVSGFNVCEVFAKHLSVIRITASGHAFVEVDVFDDAVVYVTARDSARVHVNRYGSAKAVVDGQEQTAYIKITDKKKKTY